MQDTVVYIPDCKRQKEYWTKKEQVTDKEEVSPMHDTTVSDKTQGFKVGDRVVTLWGKKGTTRCPANITKLPSKSGGYFTVKFDNGSMGMVYLKQISK